MTKELELELSRQKLLIIEGITNCTSERQLEKYVYELSKVYIEKSRLHKYHKTDISNAKVLKDH